jgi:Protein of unknown function (DUF3179)
MKMMIGFCSAMLLTAGASAERPEPEVVATWGGDEVYQVLPLGAIPAIDEPVFVTGAAADAQMRPEEPVLGVVIGDTARAYSLWQLDRHELVNDSIEGTAIAATW